MLKENNSPHFYQTPLSSVISKWCRQGFLPSCEAGPRVPPADSLWETMVTFILALLEALLGVGLGVCLLLPWGLNSSLSRPSIWSLVTGTAPCKQTNKQHRDKFLICSTFLTADFKAHLCWMSFKELCEVSQHFLWHHMKEGQWEEE